MNGPARHHRARRVWIASNVDWHVRRLLAIVHLTRTEFDLEDRVIFRLAEELIREDTLLKLGRAWARKRIVPVR